MPRQSGFTLVELMIVVAIMGVLASIAIPQMGAMTRKSHEASTKANIGALRSALAIYFADNEGQLPLDDLTSLTISQKYLQKIPYTYVQPYHSPGNVVGTGNRASYVASSADLTHWWYFNVPGDAEFGMVLINCIHNDIRGLPWTSY